MTWTQIERLRRKYERRYRRKIYDALMQQLKDVLLEVNVGVLDIMTEKINTIVSNNSIKKAFYNLYNDVGWEFFRLAKFRKSIEDIERSLWDEVFEAWVERETGSRITLITDFSKELLKETIRKVLAQGQQQGLGIIEMERLLRETLTSDFRTMARMRSLRIVQTEVMSASNFATLKAGEQSGIQMMKVWMTAPVGVAKTERHAVIEGLDGQRRAKGQDFDVGGVPMAYPGDPKGGAENVVNCRCVMSWEPVENMI